MQTLSERIRNLRGNRTVLDFAKVTDVSRGALKDAEDGKSIRLSTLKKIAKACDTDHSSWISLLISWIRVEVGEENFQNIDVRPATLEVDHLLPGSKEVSFGFMLEMIFRHLSSRDQVEIFKAMTRPAVRECLTAINRVIDGFVGSGSFLVQPVHPMINSPEKFNDLLKKLEEGDESVFASRSNKFARNHPREARSPRLDEPAKKKPRNPRPRRKML
jgi:hypothetical protein